MAAKKKTKEPTYEEKVAKLMAEIMVHEQEKQRKEQELSDLEFNRHRIGFKWYD